MVAGQPELRLDLFFPGIEIVLNFKRQNLSELRVDAADIRSQRLNERGYDNQHNETGDHRRLPLRAAAGTTEERSIRPWGSPSWPRRIRSRRAICPASVSWS